MYVNYIVASAGYEWDKGRTIYHLSCSASCFKYIFYFAVCAAGLMTFVLQLSFGPIGWLMISEVFPLRLRGRGLGIAVLVNFGANALVTFAFSPLKVLSFVAYLYTQRCFLFYVSLHIGNQLVISRESWTQTSALVLWSNIASPLSLNDCAVRTAPSKTINE